VIHYSYFACFLLFACVFFCSLVSAQVSGHVTVFVRTVKQFDYGMSDIMWKYIDVKANFALCIRTYVCMYIRTVYTHISSLMMAYECRNIVAC
jgi:hypothetical protein